jgi:hypothetical protein
MWKIFKFHVYLASTKVLFTLYLNSRACNTSYLSLQITVIVFYMISLYFIYMILTTVFTTARL